MQKEVVVLQTPLIQWRLIAMLCARIKRKLRYIPAFGHADKLDVGDHIAWSPDTVLGHYPVISAFGQTELVGTSVAHTLLDPP